MVAGELEYRDVVVPSLVPGTLDYTSIEASAAAWDEACTVHHRRPARKLDGWKVRKYERAGYGLADLLINYAHGQDLVGGTEDPPFPGVDRLIGGTVCGRKYRVTVRVTLKRLF